MRHTVLAAAGGFLMAILWMDLLFDVQAAGSTGTVLPEAVLASIAAYYRRVTTDAYPMDRLIALVMIACVGNAGLGLRQRVDRSLQAVAVLLVISPVILAGARVLPNAIKLGARSGTVAEQSALAQRILHDHIACLLSIAGFILVQFVLARRARDRASHAA